MSEPEKQRKVVLLYHGPISGASRRVDIEYWQSLGPSAIFEAAWQCVIDAYAFRKGDPRELRLQRSVVHFQRGRS